MLSCERVYLSDDICLRILKEAGCTVVTEGLPSLN